MAIRKEDYLEWLDHPVTKEAAKDISETAEEVVGRLVKNRDNTHSEDTWYKGFISGIQALIDWSPEFIEEEVKNAKD